MNIRKAGNKTIVLCAPVKAIPPDLEKELVVRSNAQIVHISAHQALIIEEVDREAFNKAYLFDVMSAYVDPMNIGEISITRKMNGDRFKPG